MHLVLFIVTFGGHYYISAKGYWHEHNPEIVIEEKVINLGDVPVHRLTKLNQYKRHNRE